MNRVSGCIDLELLLKKIFCETFSQLRLQVGIFDSKASFKIIKVNRIDEHEQPNSKSESSKHLKNNPGHKSDWMIKQPCII